MIDQPVCRICREDTAETTLCRNAHCRECTHNCTPCMNELRDEGW